MIKKILIELVLAIALIGAIAFAFYKWKYLPENSLNIISVEREVALGKMIEEQMVKYDFDIQELNDPNIDSAVALIADRLIAALDSPLYDFNIKVVQSEEINAVTLPGGNIYIYKGLITFSQSAEEVAAVLAHEIGHAQERHIVSRLIKQLGISVVFGVLSGGDPQVIIQMVQMVVQNVFNRKQEEEADTFGLQLLEKAQINPTYLGKFFQRLEDDGKTYDEELEIFMTHPHHKNRIKASEEYQTAPGFIEVPLGLEWSTLKNAL